jgi:hypothetical protein
MTSESTTIPLGTNRPSVLLSPSLSDAMAGERASPKMDRSCWSDIRGRSKLLELDPRAYSVGEANVPLLLDAPGKERCDGVREVLETSRTRPSWAARPAAVEWCVESPPPSLPPGLFPPMAPGTELECTVVSIFRDRLNAARMVAPADLFIFKVPSPPVSLGASGVCPTLSASLAAGAVSSLAWMAFTSVCVSGKLVWPTRTEVAFEDGAFRIDLRLPEPIIANVRAFSRGSVRERMLITR